MVGAILVASCSGTRSAGSDAATQVRDREARAAVLRQVLRGAGADQPQTLCIRIGSEGPLKGHDPSPELLGDFSDGGRTAVGGSECALENPVGIMRHTLTGRPALLVYVSDVTWQGTDVGVVRAGYARGSLDGRSCMYTVARQLDGTWEVGPCEGQILSRAGEGERRRGPDPG